MTYDNSRWQRVGETAAKKRAAALFAASGLILILVLVFGIPAVFKLTSIILNTRKETVSQSDPTFTPATPRLSQDFEATNSAQIKIDGVADGKIIVELFQNSNSQGTTIAGDDGTFSFDVNLLNGENNFTAQAISSANKRSYQSDVYKISLLNKPPKLEFTDLKDSFEVNTTPYNLAGVTDPGVTVTINDHFVFVDASGNFKYSLNLNSGDNKVVILARDKAGNETKKEVLIKSTATP